MPQRLHDILETHRRGMLRPVHIEQNLRDQGRCPITPGLDPPILLGEEPAFPKRESPKLRLT